MVRACFIFGNIVHMRRWFRRPKYSCDAPKTALCAQVNILEGAVQNSTECHEIVHRRRWNACGSGAHGAGRFRCALMVGSL